MKPDSSLTPVSGQPNVSTELPTSGSQGRIPRVCLDAEHISDAMAARLAMCLLGHVLFLKNQVPFPVIQLARIRGGSSNTSAAKKRSDLLSSFDTLSSHLSTTFTALSTALARLCPGATEKTETSGGRATTFLAILVGPSVGSAKSKVVLAVDGLEVKIWGERDDEKVKGESESENDEESEDGSETDESGCDDEDGASESSSEDEDVPDSGDDEDGDEGPVECDETTAQSSNTNIQSHPPIRSSPSSRPRESTVITQRTPSHADEQQAFRAAERTLSRVLATADSEGHGMGSELSPTQTHILLRAPRHFVHPAWVPRQNMCSALDGMLGEFMEASGLSSERDEGRKAPKKKRKNRTEVEGVWVRCREIESDAGLMGLNGEVEETDELIWWSWEGKIVGFADW